MNKPKQASRLDVLAPYLQHLERCDKWRDGWWNNNYDCSCGLEEALLTVDEAVIEEIVPEAGGRS